MHLLGPEPTSCRKYHEQVTQMLIKRYGTATSRAGLWERNTFPYLYKLATEEPAAGIHLQNTIVWARKKDTNSITGKWTAETTTASPWFKELVPDVSIACILTR